MKYLDKILQEAKQELSELKEQEINHDCHLSPEDGCQTCEDYRNYIDQEVRELNTR